MSESLYIIREVVNRDYQLGFVTEVEQDMLPPGLDEPVDEVRGTVEAAILEPAPDGPLPDGSV